VEDKDGAIVLTVFLLIVFSLCFLVNICTIRITNKLEAFILMPPLPSYFAINMTDDSARTTQVSLLDDNWEKE